MKFLPGPLLLGHLHPFTTTTFSVNEFALTKLVHLESPEGWPCPTSAVFSITHSFRRSLPMLSFFKFFAALHFHLFWPIPFFKYLLL